MTIYRFSILILLVGMFSCTDLTEELNSDLPADEAEAFLKDNADYDALLQTVYRDFDNSIIQHYDAVWVITEMSSDEAICPSRPSGWDNGGVYRELHQHTWKSTHDIINNVWGDMNEAVFDATNVLAFDPPADVAAEARFLRAYFMWIVLDLWDQVPFREPGDNLLDAPTVLVGSDAADFIISEIEDVLPLLSNTNPDYRANQNAAHALLAKMYINKGVYANRANPTFSDADMDKVIEHVDAISGKSIDFYWDSFGPDNNDVSSEIIFSIESIGGVRGTGQWLIWFATFPAEMVLPGGGGGWNGFATISEFYNSFEDKDIRRYYEHPTTKDNGGYNVGFLTGQQYDVDGNPIQDVVFTEEVPTIVGATLWNGYRPLKYVPDFANGSSTPDNDFVLLRYSDMLLLKAEAELRKGNDSEALTIVNEIRTNRNLDDFSSLDLDALLAERGRELYWEGHRRNDQVRFGTFLGSWTLKEASDPMYLIFPIPPEDVLSNPNLTQNPGY
ncbi:MAG: RagB/SusD family nutrient uptake outer membrane protein [Cyclobacteriaceae bacterium]